MVARAVDQFGSPELKEAVMAPALSGGSGCVLGYTEPEGAPTLRPAGRARARRRRLGHQRFQDVHVNAQNAAYVYLTPTPIRPRPNTRA